MPDFNYDRKALNDLTKPPTPLFTLHLLYFSDYNLKCRNRCGALLYLQ